MMTCETRHPNAQQTRLPDVDDTTLLRAIIEQRDRSAFSELFLRYQESAYSLACHILQNKALAEEAVQESMLALWLSPPADLQGREPRDWILGTVAGKSLNIRRGQKKQSRRERAVADRRNTAFVPTAAAEGQELLAALRSQIEELPPLESQLIACCFGANLTHQKIGELFGIPKSTITHRIQQALEQLKINLQKAGLAALVPLAGAQGIQQALTQGMACPASLHSGVLNALACARSASTATTRAVQALRRVRSTRRGAAPGSNGAVPIAIGVLLIGCVVLVSKADSSKPVEAAKPEPVASVAAPAPAPKPAKIFKRWVFDRSGIDTDFTFVHGTRWAWQKYRGTGCMSSTSDDFAVICVPVELDHRPVRVTMRKTNSRGKSGNCQAAVTWCDTAFHSVPWEYWMHNYSIKSEQIVETMIIYFKDEYCLNFNDKMLNAVNKYAVPYPSNHLYLTLRNIRVQEITVETIDDDELPAQFQNMPATIAGLVSANCEHSFK